jgi:hypothetical protein
MDCRVKPGNDEGRNVSPRRRIFETEIIMKAIWDEALLKQRERNAREDTLAVQSDDDWARAVLRLERGMSGVSGGFRDCPLRACRRARRCAGDRPVCMPRCKVELEPGAEQELCEEFYAEIQEERRNAAAEGRAPRLVRVIPQRAPVVEVAATGPSSPPVPHGPERKKCTAPEVMRSETAPSQPLQPQLPKPEPAAAPSPIPLAADVRPAAPAVPAAPPPAAWEPTITPEVEERINRIWADYVAGRPMPRPVPRIRSL